MVNACIPDIVVFDRFPDFQFAQAVTAVSVPTVRCVRNMGNYAKDTEDKDVRHVLQECVSLIAPHAEADSSIPEQWRNRALFTGPIVKPLPLNPTPVHLTLNLAGKRVIVLTSGGGGHRDAVAF
jgi:hypothetical protein